MYVLLLKKKMQYFFSTGQSATISDGSKSVIWLLFCLKTGVLPSELNDEPPSDFL